MKSQAVLYHNVETDYLSGTVVVDVEGDVNYPKIIAEQCEAAMALAGGRDKFISCLHLEDGRWEIKVDLTFTSENHIDAFMQNFNAEGIER